MEDHNRLLANIAPFHGGIRTKTSSVSIYPEAKFSHERPHFYGWRGRSACAKGPARAGVSPAGLATTARASSRRRKARGVSAAAAIHRSPSISIRAGTEILIRIRAKCQTANRPTQRQ